jgi:hypothetical protein
MRHIDKWYQIILHICICDPNVMQVMEERVCTDVDDKVLNRVDSVCLSMDFNIVSRDVSMRKMLDSAPPT